MGVNILWGFEHCTWIIRTSLWGSTYLGTRIAETRACKLIDNQWREVTVCILLHSTIVCFNVKTSRPIFLIIIRHITHSYFLISIHWKFNPHDVWICCSKFLFQTQISQIQSTRLWQFFNKIWIQIKRVIRFDVNYTFNLKFNSLILTLGE